MDWQQTFLFECQPCEPVTPAVAATKRSRRAANQPKLSENKLFDSKSPEKVTEKKAREKVAVANVASTLPEPSADEPPADEPLSRVERLRRLVHRMEGRVGTIESDQPAVFSAGGAVLDRLLPHGGLRPGTLVEWVCDARRSGANLLAMIAAANILAHESSGNRPLVVVDGLGDGSIGGGEAFYPPAAMSLGIPADAMIVMRKQRGHSRGDLIWAIDQSLRSGAVAAVYAEIGDWLDPADARRLQLAAEAGGAVGLLVRPIGYHRGGQKARPAVAAPANIPRRAATPASIARPVATRPSAARASFADVRWLVSSLPGLGGRRLQVELDRCRGGVTGSSRVIEIDVAFDRLADYGSSSGDVRLAPAVMIREAQHQRLVQQNGVSSVGGKLAEADRVGGSSDAATKMASDLVGRLADPATAANAGQRRQPAGPSAGKSADRRHAG
jgi:hypothetical protein